MKKHELSLPVYMKYGTGNRALIQLMT